MLLNPHNYDNFPFFYKLSQEDNLEKYHYQIDKYINNRYSIINLNNLIKVRKVNYKQKKICEDKIFEKYKELLN